MKLKHIIIGMAVAMFASFGTAQAQDGDPAKGKDVFKKCVSCHRVGPNVKNSVGPILNGIVGKPAAQIEGYKYSDAMKNAAAAGLVWDEATLHEYLVKPQAKVPGTKMTFPGLPKEDDINNVIAYLKTFTAEGQTAAAN